MKTVVLVYSGGLDTSICIPLLREEYGYEKIVTATIDVGQPQEDIDQATRKAQAMGTEHYTVDAKEEFAANYCFQSVRAGGDYQGYPMSTSLARPLIGEKAVEVARKTGATAFAHGCTGKGNDQFRIELAIRSLMPEATIHAPIRERNMTRSWEVEYAQSKGVPIAQSLDKIWSIDENLWGRSIEGGRLEEPDFAPPEKIFAWTADPSAVKQAAQTLSLEFDQGIPVKVNNEAMTAAQIITRMNELAGQFGIGRIDIMEDRLLGLKVRENYECPAATVISQAHLALEGLVLTRDERRFKKAVSEEWSQLAYEGRWFDPLKDALDSFIATLQKRVTGHVNLKLSPGTCMVTGRQSPWALYSEEMASFDSFTFDQSQMTGQVKNFALQARFFHQLKQKVDGRTTE